MTTGEKHEIESRFSKHFSSGEVQLATVSFGKPNGRACTKLLWQHMVKSHECGWHHNEALSSIMPSFTIAKSLLLSSRAMQQKVEDGDGCYCFPRTSIMPAGCAHYPVALGKAPSSSKSKPFHCSQCSRCLRCDKSLAWSLKLADGQGWHTICIERIPVVGANTAVITCRGQPFRLLWPEDLQEGRSCRRRLLLPPLCTFLP